jgi:tetratricopeptide (TPR) repeat protein
LFAHDSRLRHDLSLHNHAARRLLTALPFLMLRLLSLTATAALGAFGLATHCVHAAPADATLSFFEARVKSDPDDFIAWNKLADARMRLLSTTGDLSHLTRAAEAVEKSLKAVPPEFNRAGVAMRVRVQLAAHRFEEARRSAEELRGLMPGKAYPLQVLGDALINLGDYEAAARTWKEMAAMDEDENALATEPRFAQLDVIYGRVEQARERLAKALEQAQKAYPPSPENVAWYRVQLGELAFKSGNWDAAQTHYDAALSAQPDYYAALDHMAELRGAQGKVEEAVALYTRVIERTHRPEFMQALGDLYAFAGKPNEAKSWHERACDAYLASVERGEVLYFHHLAGFYADSLNEPEKAVEWAQRDLTLRHGIQADDALAWALYKAGKIEEARDTIAKALATGTHDAHILYHAGMIRMSAGDIAGGKGALQQALAANPRHNTFHVHR